VKRLSKHAQRATYGALTTSLGYQPAAAQAVGNRLDNCPRDHLHSWVVRKKDGLPSGYEEKDLDPRLPGSSSPIEDPAILLAWLTKHP
jgi:hypothetical protein